jgi:hypothetical protein
MMATRLPSAYNDKLLLQGLTYISDQNTHDILVKWWNVMTPAVFAGVMLVSINGTNGDKAVHYFR